MENPMERLRNSRKKETGENSNPENPEVGVESIIQGICKKAEELFRNSDFPELLKKALNDSRHTAITLPDSDIVSENKEKYVRLARQALSNYAKTDKSGYFELRHKEGIRNFEIFLDSL